MPNNDQNTEEVQLDDLTDQETPEGTPSDSGDSGVSGESGETPAGSDSAGSADEGKHQKTPEQIKEDAAHWQSKYQELKESGYDADAAKRELTGGGTDLDSIFGGTEEKPASGDGMSGVTAEDVQRMSDDQLNDLLRENPALALRVMNEMTRRELQSTQRASEAQRTFELEKDRAKLVLNKYVSENKIDSGEVKKAQEYLSSLGVKAHPSKVAALMIDRIEHQRLMGMMSQRAKEAEVKASQAAKKQALTQQPDGSQPEPPKPKTLADVVQGKFKKSQSDKALDNLFGG